MTTNTVKFFLDMAPAWVSIIKALELAIPQKGMGDIKRVAFTNQVLDTIAIAAPAASEGLSAPHDPETVTMLATKFAANIVLAMNAAKATA